VVKSLIMLEGGLGRGGGGGLAVAPNKKKCTYVIT